MSLADCDLPNGSIGNALLGFGRRPTTVIHFGAVLLLAALVCAPWHGVFLIAHLLLLMGIIGLAYSAITLVRLHRQTSYRPELEDWLFHVVFPILPYATLAGSALEAGRHLHEAMFGVASSALLLLFIGIHNAWDAVTYHVFVQRKKKQEN